ncbi:sugar transporter [Cytobacillus firmus]|uniref:BglG family transcription antiterminator n=1 Tax=Cytobacillus firmus TaxID=1399 RepID=UPI00077C32A0|nr:BglG family transcription antiterminator [Cytobacillus firmus]MBG9543158.1 sugar transporter [Cytobacillus firmus]MBG9552461.1 sugar transporter [Cytobacillus firmus]MBG9558878.1 sugar transporter [Cytobacillus firmus]MBG9575460.1 sugar transporter [Cytobacillus firmus]MEC1892956.1 BglG family transcription antiterminator [Cytobacillus firmus]
MYITSREKAIIELIIKTSGKHTALSIASSLNVSARTIQRDLKAVEKIVNEFGLTLTRNVNQGLVIEGKNEQIFRLIQHLTNSEPIDELPQEKKLRLLLAILEEDVYKTQVLAGYLGISTATLTAYLDELAEWLSLYRVGLTRKRGVGVELHGTEANKRMALAQFLLQFFHEELIEKLFLLEKGKLGEDRILHYFEADDLRHVNSTVQTVFKGAPARFADSGYLEIVLHTCISLKRTLSGFPVERKDLPEAEVTIEYELIQEVTSRLGQAFDCAFSEGDVLYLARILKGTKWSGAEAFPYDSIVLAHMIRNVIKSVSEQLHVDLNKDFSLFQGLLAHMEPSLYRIKQNMGSYNPLREEIKRKYPVLFMAVKNSLEEEFTDIDQFSDDEIAFIVLHFGSALVMQEEHLSIKALLICPTGIGTSKMLKSRLKKEVAEIDVIEIKSIKEMSEGANLKEYDLILSTVRLPFIHAEYILVNPLLSEENIVTIKNYLKNNIESLTKGKHYLEQPEGGHQSQVSLDSMLEEIRDIQESIQSLIQNFRFYRMDGETSQEQILAKMLANAEGDQLLTNPEDVLQSLREREHKGGLGIPETNMALFHVRSQNVRRLIFQIAHLQDPCLVKGMDGKEVAMKNLLLMLAPDELSRREQEIVSLISTNIIETEEAILLFSSANEEMIFKKLESIFTEYLQSHFKLNR